MSKPEKQFWVTQSELTRAISEGVALNEDILREELASETASKITAADLAGYARGYKEGYSADAADNYQRGWTDAMTSVRQLTFKNRNGETEK